MPATAQILPFHPKPTDLVDIAYQALERVGCTRRSGQEELSRKILSALLAGEPLCAEAATGTGKTFAYLVGALLAQAQNALPIVISTATVALQEQVFHKDIPVLVEAGLLSADHCFLSKGRNRYFCPQQAKEHLSTTVAHPLQLALVEDYTNLEDETDFYTHQMLEAWVGQEWAGDRDSWPRAVSPRVWQLVQADRETCQGSTCPDFHECPFYKDRISLAKAQVLVTNHDLLLADLQSRTKGKNTVFPFPTYQLLVDEAHRLPEIARKSADSEIDVRKGLKNLQSLQSWLQTCRLSGKGVDDLVVMKDAAHAALLPLLKEAEALRLKPGAWFRFPQGKLTGTWKTPSQAASFRFTELSDGLQDFTRKLKYQKDPAALALLTQGRELIQQIRDMQTGLARFSEMDTRFQAGARWVEAASTGLFLRYAPLSGADILLEQLWASDIRTVLVSATLRALGTFDNYREEAGLPLNTRFWVVPPVLPYRLSLMHCPPLSFRPNDAGFAENLIKELPWRINPSEGTLLLFTNRETMEEVVDHLPEYLRKRCLVQGRTSTAGLVERHRHAIEKGEGSILVGLQSFSEGLDLPGKLCTHVIITRLPFVVPGSPLEESKEEVHGSDYFQKVMLPLTSRNLVQMAGRLVRRMTDTGKITCLDVRLRQSQYGKDLLDSLPDFTRDFSSGCGFGAIL